MRWMDTERVALVETFRGADPEDPTLCPGWNVRHMLAHLVMREHSPVNQLLDTAAKPDPGHEKRLSALAATAATPEGYEDLIRQFAAGTGAGNPMTWLGDEVQLLEYVIHHEDVRRGAGNVEPRELPAGQADAVWKKLPMMAKMSYHASPVGITMATPEGGADMVHKGSGMVVLTGAPVELALYVSGRRAPARVEVTGAPEDKAIFLAWVSRKQPEGPQGP